MNEKLEALLLAIAQRMNVTAERAFEILVDGNFASGMASIASTAMFVVSLVALAATAYGVLKRADDLQDYGKRVDRQFVAAIGLIVGIVFAVVVCLRLDSAILALYAPEYLALKEILQTVK